MVGDAASPVSALGIAKDARISPASGGIVLGDAPAANASDALLSRPPPPPPPTTATMTSGPDQTAGGADAVDGGAAAACKERGAASAGSPPAGGQSRKRSAELAMLDAPADPDRGGKREASGSSSGGSGGHGGSGGRWGESGLTITAPSVGGDGVSKRLRSNSGSSSSGSGSGSGGEGRGKKRPAREPTWDVADADGAEGGRKRRKSPR